MPEARTRRKPTIAVLHLGKNGGGPKFAYELTRGLQAAGCRTLAVIASGADNRSAFEAAGATLALPTFTSMRGALARSPLIAVNALRVRRQLARGRVDAVVVAMEQVWQGPLLLLTRRADRPQLLCVHDATLHPGEHNFLEHNLRSLQRSVADGAVVFSEHVGSSLVDAGVFPADRVWRTVHGAYGRLAERPHAVPDEDRPPTVGFFGRISKYKGLELCYEAVGLLRDSGRRIRFALVGSGADPTLSRMTHPDDDVRVEWVDDESIADVLSDFSVLALPYTEASQSGVFAYAMSQGLPMVATPVGGLREQAEQSGAALVAAEPNAKALAAVMERVLTDADLYETLGWNGLTAAGKEHSWERVGTDVLDIVLSLIDRGWRR